MMIKHNIENIKEIITPMKNQEKTNFLLFEILKELKTIKKMNKND